MDTACASSLYAVDMAMKMMEAGRAQAMVILGKYTSMAPGKLYKYYYRGWSLYFITNSFCFKIAFAILGKGL
ncbi:MAG TPA: hypothetical protein DD405_03920 [Desulfobacteraceae bacterium]|nr:hypothetical protein [Desulfobacteraceae bacterium]